MTVIELQLYSNFTVLEVRGVVRVVAVAEERWVIGTSFLSRKFIRL